MCIQKIGFKIFLCIFLSCLCVSQAYGESHSSLRSSRKHVNDNRFRFTNVQKVIAEICKKLQIDLKHKTAQQNFSMIANHPSLTARQRAQVFLLEDLLKFNENLKRRANYLTLKRDYLKNQFIQNGYNSQTFLDGLRDIEHNLSRINSTRVHYDQPLFEHNDPLKVIYQTLNDEKGKQLVRVEYLREQYRWLQMVGKNQKDYLSTQKAIQSTNNDDSIISNNVIKIEREPLQEEVEVNISTPYVVTLAPTSDQENNFIEYDRGEDFSREQLNGLREDLKQKDQKINDLSAQIVDLSLKMSEIEILLNKKVDSMELLKVELIDATQRFMLEKRIIQEKNTEIQLLQTSLDQLKGGSENDNYVSFVRDDKLAELSGILEIYKYKLVEKNRLAKEKTRALAKTQDDLLLMKNQLFALEFDLLELKKNPDQSELRDFEMESKVWKLRSKFKDIQSFLLENLDDSDKMKSRRKLESSNRSN